MEETNQNYIYGFPKVTQVIFVSPSLEALLVRIPRTFFIDQPYQRFVHYEGLNFEVYRINENAENHSTVCTGVLKYHPPKTLKQLRDLITVLTYFAKRDQNIIRLIKDISSKQLHRMAMQVQATSLPFIDLTTESARPPKTTHHQKLANTRENQRGFHPYSKIPKMINAEGGSSRGTAYQHFPHAPTPSPQAILSQSYPIQNSNCNQSVFGKVSMLNQSQNISLTGESFENPHQTNYYKQSDISTYNQYQERNSSSGMGKSFISYTNNFQDHKPHEFNFPDLPHTFTSNNVKHDVQNYLQQSDYGNSNQTSLQTQIADTSPEVLNQLTANSDYNQLNQIQSSQQGQTQTFPPNLNNNSSNFLRNSFRNPIQQVQYQPQIQTSRQRLFAEPTNFSLNNEIMVPSMNQSSRINQSHYANNFSYQHQPSQNIPIVTTSLPCFSTSLQVNSHPQNYIPLAPVNHYPSVSFHNNAFIDNNQTQLGPSTSNYPLEANFSRISESQTTTSYENLYNIQPPQYLYSQGNFMQWSNNTLLAPDSKYSQVQNHQVTLPMNSHVNYKSLNLFKPQTPYQQQEQQNWQTPWRPQMENHQPVQPTQARNLLTTTLLNKPLNTKPAPLIQESSYNDPKPPTSTTNSLCNATSANSSKSNGLDVQSNTTNQVDQVDLVNKIITGAPTSKKNQCIPPNPAEKSPNNLQQVLNVIDKYVKSVSKINVQGSMKQFQLDRSGHSQDNSYDTCFIKQEPIDYEELQKSRATSMNHDPISFVSLDKETKPTDGVLMTENIVDGPPLITIDDDDFEDDIQDIMNKHSYKVIYSPPKSRDTSPCLIIDENAMI